MSYVKPATTGPAAAVELMKAVSGARRELLLEVYQCGWAPCSPGILVHKATSITLPTMHLLDTLTADSADPNYVRLVSQLLRAGWNVHHDGQVYHNDGHGPMPVYEALLACINVASEA